MVGSQLPVTEGPALVEQKTNLSAPRPASALLGHQPGSLADNQRRSLLPRACDFSLRAPPASPGKLVKPDSGSHPDALVRNAGSLGFNEAPRGATGWHCQDHLGSPLPSPTPSQVREGPRGAGQWVGNADTCGCPVSSATLEVPPRARAALEAPPQAGGPQEVHCMALPGLGAPGDCLRSAGMQPAQGQKAGATSPLWRGPALWSRGDPCLSLISSLTANLPQILSLGS